MSGIDYLAMLQPEIVLMIAACGVLFLSFCKPLAGRNASGLFALAAIAIAAGRLPSAAQAGTGLAGTLLADNLTAYVRLITLAVGAAIVLVNWYQAADGERGEYTAMVLFSMSGVMLTAIANDLILLFFALELVSVPTYVLVALSREDIRAQEACSKYFFLGSLAAAITAYGMSFLYGATGTTVLAALPGDPLGTIGMLLVLGGLCFKIAAVPFHGYVADVYEGAAAPLAGALGFLPKLAGLVGLIKLIGLSGWALTPSVWWAVWVIAALTMTVGNLLALMQNNLKRLLAYSGVAHAGTMLVGLLAGPLGPQPLGNGLGATLFYVAVYGFMNLGAFALLACVGPANGEAQEVGHLRGLSRRRPWLAAALAVCFFSLMGMPPTAGFLGKFYVFSSAMAGGAGPFGQGLLVLAVIGVINSAIGAAYYLRVIGAAFSDDAPRADDRFDRPTVQLGVAVCTMLMLVWFIWPHALLRQAQAAANSSIDRTPVAVQPSAAVEPAAAL